MRTATKLAIAGSLLALLAAGCLGDPAAPDTAGASDGEPAAEPASDAGREPGSLTVLDDGRLEVQVPVHVAVIGFEADVADGLADELDRQRVEHAYGSWPRDAPPTDPSDPDRPAKLNLWPVQAFGWDWRPMPIVPVADYRVHAADADLENRTRDQLRAALAEDTASANPVESMLARELPDHGVPVDADAPTLVFLHAANLLDERKGEHSWTYELPGGPLEQVRVFGEREPVLVLDASAAPDPWTQSPNEEQPRYGTPRNATGERAVSALAEAAHDATHLRLLQGTFYEMQPAPCHAVTLLLADRPRPEAPTRADPTEHVDVDRLEAEIEAITGPARAHVDARVVHLPADDPALAQATRGSYADRDGLRTYLDENWDDYWVEHEGCEAYMMLAMATHDGEFEAVAIHGEDEDRRIGLAFVPGTWAELSDAMERYILHEVGHLIGPAHPHVYTTWDENWSYPNGPSGDFSSRWSSIWSPASYQTGGGFGGGPTLGLAYGVQDRANTLRAMVGFAWQDVHEAGLADEAEARAALEDVRGLDWGPALEHLLSLREQAG